MTFRNAFYYDYRSNLTCVRDPQNGLTYYDYDAENRQISVRNPWGEVTYYEYSPGEQMTKRTLGNPLHIVREDGYATYYQYDVKSQLIGETQRTGQGLEAMRRGSASRFYHFDWLGSTFELTDASGVVTDSYLYNAWGEVLARMGTTSNPHGYVGLLRYYFSPVLPLLLGVRYYDLREGRFLSQDPLQGDLSPYVYAKGLPISRRDPTGLRCCPTRITPSLGQPSCETKWSAGNTLVRWDYQVQWTMTVSLSRASKPEHCWCKQWERERNKSWKADNAKGWPYPMAPTKGGYRPGPPYVTTLMQSDAPGIHSSTPVQNTAANDKLYVDFVTCLCNVELKHQCFRWSVAFEIKDGYEISCKASYQGPTKESAAPGACIPMGSQSTRRY